MNFIAFRDAVAKNFSEMQQHQLYRTAAPKDGLWATYLAAFPEGSDLLTQLCCRQITGTVKVLVTSTSFSCLTAASMTDRLVASITNF